VNTAVTAGCPYIPFNAVITRVPQGACAVSPSLIGCSGHCESGAFPARRAVTLVTWHRVTSAARCCTIGSLSVTVSCPDGRSVTLQTC
uniref:Uncharacterized protein n=1 Tax=Coturnix japonica TaxID=93934 RepID=A0A8C2SQT9_COTJA